MKPLVVPDGIEKRLPVEGPDGLADRDVDELVSLLEVRVPPNKLDGAAVNELGAMAAEVVGVCPNMVDFFCVASPNSVG